MENNQLEFDRRAATRALARADRRLGRWMKRIGPFKMRVVEERDAYETLLRAIIYQQLHGKAAAAIYKRVCALSADGRAPLPEKLLEAPARKLRAAGLSRQKMGYLRDLARKRLDGTIPSIRVLKRMTNEEIIERLTSVHGVGVWTVEMFLIFKLGRADVLPTHDFGVRKGFGRLLGLKKEPKPKQVAEYGERWRPYRSVASWYLWRVAELPGKK